MVLLLLMRFKSSKLLVLSSEKVVAFGDTLDDTHTFTGSVSITGSLELNNETVLTRTNFVEQTVNVSASDVTNGYITLSSTPVDATVVEVSAIGVSKQINAANVGASGALRTSKFSLATSSTSTTTVQLVD